MRGRVTVGGLARTGSPTSSPLSTSSRRYSICRTDGVVITRVVDPNPDPHGSALLLKAGSESALEWKADTEWKAKTDILYSQQKLLYNYIALSIYTLKINSLRSRGIAAVCVHWLPSPIPHVVPCQPAALGVPYPSPACNTHPPVPAI